VEERRQLKVLKMENSALKKKKTAIELSGGSAMAQFKDNRQISSLLVSKSEANRKLKMLNNRIRRALGVHETLVKDEAMKRKARGEGRPLTKKELEVTNSIKSLKRQAVWWKKRLGEVLNEDEEKLQEIGISGGFAGMAERALKRTMRRSLVAKAQAEAALTANAMAAWGSEAWASGKNSPQFGSPTIGGRGLRFSIGGTNKVSSGRSSLGSPTQIMNSLDNVIVVDSADKWRRQTLNRGSSKGANTMAGLMSAVVQEAVAEDDATKALAEPTPKSSIQKERVLDVSKKDENAVFETAAVGSWENASSRGASPLSRSRTVSQFSSPAKAERKVGSSDGGGGNAFDKINGILEKLRLDRQREVDVDVQRSFGDAAFQHYKRQADLKYGVAKSPTNSTRVVEGVPKEEKLTAEVPSPNVPAEAFPATPPGVASEEEISKAVPETVHEVVPKAPPKAAPKAAPNASREAASSPVQTHAAGGSGEMPKASPLSRRKNSVMNVQQELAKRWENTVVTVSGETSPLQQQRQLGSDDDGSVHDDSNSIARKLSSSIGASLQQLATDKFNDRQTNIHEKIFGGEKQQQKTPQQHQPTHNRKGSFGENRKGSFVARKLVASSSKGKEESSLESKLKSTLMGIQMEADNNLGGGSGLGMIVGGVNKDSEIKKQLESDLQKQIMDQQLQQQLHKEKLMRLALGSVSAPTASDPPKLPLLTKFAAAADSIRGGVREERQMEAMFTTPKPPSTNIAAMAAAFKGKKPSGASPLKRGGMTANTASPNPFSSLPANRGGMGGGAAVSAATSAAMSAAPSNLLSSIARGGGGRSPMAAAAAAAPTRAYSSNPFAT
jgi:hypothetical protein